MQEGDDRSVGTLEISTRLQTAIIMLDQSYAVTQVTPPKDPDQNDIDCLHGAFGHWAPVHLLSAPCWLISAVRARVGSFHAFLVAPPTLKRVAVCAE